MTNPWREGNRVRLLENGDAFFPAVQAAIDAAEREVLVETFLLAEDTVGLELRDALVAAAQRGVRVHLTVDGFGCHDLSAAFLDSLVGAGVRLLVFDPRPRLFGMRVNVLRRMHRKIVVIDGWRAFVGGINFTCAHLVAAGAGAKQDYAAAIEGPVVADITAFARTAAGLAAEECGSIAPRAAVAGTAAVQFLTRDNDIHRTDIEQAYRTAIRGARCDIMVANAFFIPGYRFLRELGDAARRGVRVVLIVQARPDQAYAIAAARRLYGSLAAAGVEIREYETRAFHGKVALVDDDWSTVGSTNLEPMSLAINLEANVCIRDAAFQADLRAHMTALAADSRRIDPASMPQRPVRDRVLAWALFAILRRYHGWAQRLPGRAPEVSVIDTPGPRAVAKARGAGRHWRWIGRGLAAVFFGAVAVMLVRYARTVRWGEVAAALAGYDRWLLVASVALAVLSFALYASYDLLARTYARHRLATRRVLTIAAISYAFNLNLGSLVGGAAFRYRLYSRAGLDPGTITRIVGFSVTTNWLGYVALSGILFATGAVELPDGWALTHAGMRTLGVLLILAAVGYIAACALLRANTWSIRGHVVHVPPFALALRQLFLSSANWLVIGAIVYLLLQREVGYPTVLGAMLLAAIAGAMTHIPAGLGVLEVVLLTALDERVSQHAVIAALLAYRAIYYIGPLLIAVVTYGRFEVVAGRKMAPS
ncbi:MAG: cardiolipin synthase ClsB [Casimicrobiaceae bacterium]